MQNMKNFINALSVLTFSLLLFYTDGYAQSPETTPPVDENPVPQGQEVEINEDNYRQFMELRDARQMRNVMPEDAFKPGSGSQKLDELPEQSQKHLRNQLREIIVQGDQWQPGDEAKQYPYVPSQAAQNNAQLQKQEAEAWGELVDSYNKRESQIYENSARSRAAMASESALDGSPGGSPGGQQSSSADAGGENSAAGQADPQSEELPNTAKITSSSSTAGVSQNAMEFLKRMENQRGEGNSGNANENGAEENTAATAGPGGPEKEPTQVTQQNNVEQSATANRSAEQNSNDADTRSMAGTSQNALEFLNKQGDDGDKSANGNADASSGESGDGDQQAAAGQQSSDEENSDNTLVEADPSESNSNETGADATTGVSQNALEYLTGDENPAGPGQETTLPNPVSTTGTLSIDELVNARGVGQGSKILPPPPKPTDDQKSGGNPPDKDGDG
jgi:hypothetical protein